MKKTIIYLLTLVLFYSCTPHDASNTFTDSRDGKVYKTVTVGDQVWLAEDLAYLPAVSPAATGSQTESHYYVYGYEGTDVAQAKATDNYGTYGVLYNLQAAMTACPEGWHLPSDAEWTQLEEYRLPTATIMTAQQKVIKLLNQWPVQPDGVIVAMKEYRAIPIIPHTETGRVSLPFREDPVPQKTHFTP